jgi:hypothetical protein
MSGISGVSQLIMQQIVMQSISQSNTQLARTADADGRMKQAAQQAEHSSDDYSKG